MARAIVVAMTIAGARLGLPDPDTFARPECPDQKGTLVPGRRDNGRCMVEAAPAGWGNDPG